MNKDYPSQNKKLFHSRLARKEEKKNIQNALFFTLLSLGLILILIFFGIPVLIKMAVFLSDIKGSNTPVEQSDQIPPASPRFNILPEYTKDEVLSLNGFAEPGSTIEIFLNGSPVGTVVTAADGTFSFSKISLSGDANEVYAVAMDEAGNKSQPSQTNNVVFDNTQPKLDISEPKEGAKFYGDSKRKIRIGGQTDTNVNLTVNERFVSVNQEGNFSIDYNLADGENTLKFIAKDLAGNQTEKEIKVSFIP